MFYFELEYHIEAAYMYIGLGPKFVNMNSDISSSIYALDGRGDLFFGSRHTYAKKVPKGSTVGVLVDRFRGSIKFFIDNEDQGWALENNEKLKVKSDLFPTVYANDGTGTVRFKQQSNQATTESIGDLAIVK